MLQMKATVFLVSFTFPPISLDLIFHSSYAVPYDLCHIKLEDMGVWCNRNKKHCCFHWELNYGLNTGLKQRWYIFGNIKGSNSSFRIIMWKRQGRYNGPKFLLPGLGSHLGVRTPQDHYCVCHQGKRLLDTFTHNKHRTAFLVLVIQLYYIHDQGSNDCLSLFDCQFPF